MRIAHATKDDLSKIQENSSSNHGNSVVDIAEIKCKILSKSGPCTIRKTRSVYIYR
jgi:hypothetical protein